MRRTLVIDIMGAMCLPNDFGSVRCWCFDSVMRVWCWSHLALGQPEPWRPPVARSLCKALLVLSERLWQRTLCAKCLYEQASWHDDSRISFVMRSLCFDIVMAVSFMVAWTKVSVFMSNGDMIPNNDAP